ncbi:unnamed protein product [Malus baccata var. baccata]
MGTIKSENHFSLEAHTPRNLDPSSSSETLPTRCRSTSPSTQLIVDHMPAYIAHPFAHQRRGTVSGQGMLELFTLKINHNGKWSENTYMGGFGAWFDYIDEMVKELRYDRFILYHYRIPRMSYKEGLRLIEWDKDVGKMCEYVPGTREIEMYLEYLNEGGILKKCVTIEDIKESRVAISITKGSGSKLKKGITKRGADHLEKWLCLLNDIAYNGDDEHEAKAIEEGQGSGDKAKDGHFNADNECDEYDEGDEGEEGHEIEEVNEGVELEANEGKSFITFISAILISIFNYFCKG